MAVFDALNRGNGGREADWHSCFVWMDLSIVGQNHRALRIRNKNVEVDLS